MYFACVTRKTYRKRIKYDFIIIFLNINNSATSSKPPHPKNGAPCAMVLCSLLIIFKKNVDRLSVSSFGTSALAQFAAHQSVRYACEAFVLFMVGVLCVFRRKIFVYLNFIIAKSSIILRARSRLSILWRARSFVLIPPRHPGRTAFMSVLRFVCEINLRDFRKFDIVKYVF